MSGLLRIGYDALVRAMSRVLAGFSARTVAGFFVDNAVSFYRIDLPVAPVAGPPAPAP